MRGKYYIKCFLLKICILSLLIHEVFFNIIVSYSSLVDFFLYAIANLLAMVSYKSAMIFHFNDILSLFTADFMMKLVYKFP